jgi:hypothetical protein
LNWRDNNPRRVFYHAYKIAKHSEIETAGNGRLQAFALVPQLAQEVSGGTWPGLEFSAYSGRFNAS